MNNGHLAIGHPTLGGQFVCLWFCFVLLRQGVSLYTAIYGLKLMILLPLLPMGWGYRQELPYTVSYVNFEDCVNALGF